MQSHRDVPGLADDALWLKRLACRVAGAQRADDLTQETLLASLRRAPPRGSRRQWLAGILRNLDRMDRRTSARRAQRARDSARLTTGPSPLRLLERNELRQRLILAVQSLAEPYRSVVVARFFEGRSSAGIAREAGLPTSTIRNRVRRGLRLVRARLEREYGGDPRALLLALPRLRPPRRRWRIRTAVAAGLLCLFGFAMPASASAEEETALPEPNKPSPPPLVEESDPWQVPAP